VDSPTYHVLVLMDFDDSYMEQLKAVSPRFTFTKRPVKSAAEVPAELWASADILYTVSVLPEPDAAPKLRWIQSHFAGVDALLRQPFCQARPEVTITSASGIHASTMAEYTFAMILAFSRRIPLMLRNQKQAFWGDTRFEIYRPLELRGATLGILGYGSIGRGIAHLAKAFGMEVLATKRNVKTPGESGAYVPAEAKDPEGELVDRLYPPEATKSMVSFCDFVVCVLPLTPETRQVVNGEVFAAMRRTAVFINVGRGETVDEEAMLKALQNKQIAGAALDVFEKEPLNPKSPLWQLDNVIISPHLSGNSDRYHERAIAVFAENLRRFAADAALLNLVDPKRGY
jgi:phosphoglycerate dehydrogenase-like enzyme